MQPLPFWDLPGVWGYMWALPSGGGQYGSCLLILPNTPTPNPTSSSPPRGCSRQLQVTAASAETIEPPAEPEAKAGVACVWGGRRGGGP